MSPSTQSTDVLIVGGGPAGIQASRLLKKLAPELEVVMLRPEPASVIYCAIPYAIEGVIEHEKILKADSLVTDAGVKLIKEEAVACDLESRIVETSTGKRLNYEKLLVVTGALPFVPPVEGKDLERIVTVKTAADAERIARLASEANHAVVIGAGAIGLEQAQALKHRGLEVDLVDMAPHPVPAMVDEEFGSEIIAKLTDMGIKFHGNTPLAGFEGNKAVAKVLVGDGKAIELEEGKDFVVVAIGVRPHLGPFADTDLEQTRHGLVVDNRMRTSRPEVYAAGDCVQFYSGIDGKPLGGQLGTNAVPMAKVAAKNMVGIEATYPGFFNGAATCVGELRVGGTGFTQAVAAKRGFETIAGWGETTSRFPIMPGATPVKVKIVAEKDTGRILGGQVLGQEAVAQRVDIITLAIQQRLSVHELAELSYSAQPWQTFFPARNAIVQACEDAAEKL